MQWNTKPQIYLCCCCLSICLFLFFFLIFEFFKISFKFYLFMASHFLGTLDFSLHYNWLLRSAPVLNRLSAHDSSALLWSRVVRHPSDVDNFSHFRLHPLKPLNGIQRNITGNKISSSSTKLVFFFPVWSEKQDGRPVRSVKQARGHMGRIFKPKSCARFKSTSNLTFKLRV